MTPQNPEARARQLLSEHNGHSADPPTPDGAGSTSLEKPSEPAKPSTQKKQKDIARALLDTALAACSLVRYAGRPYAVVKQGSQWAGVFGPPGTAQSFSGGQLRRSIVRLARLLPEGRIIGKDVADRVLLHLEAEADHGEVIPLSLRFRHIPDHPQGPRVYLDLGRADARCVEITAAGWTITEQIPPGVAFLRSHTVGELPIPRRSGCLADLAGILALPPESREFRLVLGWVLGLPFDSSIRPGLLLLGPPGIGKSTCLRLATSVWEPSPAHYLGSALGRKHDDDQVRALHHAVPLWDNLSGVSAATSDLLCCIITGSSLEGRRYYSNADIDTHPITRPVGLSSIGMPAGLRPDALDRLVTVELPPVAHRIEDAALQARFDQAHPTVLGAACDAVSAALAWRTRVSTPTQYRMASYATVLTALDAATTAGALPGCPGGLLDAYDATLREVRQRTAAEDAFGGPLLTFMESLPKRKINDTTWGTTWQGTASALLAAVTGQPGVDLRAPGWPGTARRLPTVLAHLQHGLAEIGLSWQVLPTKLHGRTQYLLTLRGQDGEGALPWSR